MTSVQNRGCLGGTEALRSRQTRALTLSDQGGPAAQLVRTGWPLGQLQAEPVLQREELGTCISSQTHCCRHGAGGATTPLLPARLGLQGLQLNNTQVCQ